MSRFTLCLFTSRLFSKHIRGEWPSSSCKNIVALVLRGKQPESSRKLFGRRRLFARSLPGLGLSVSSRVPDIAGKSTAICAGFVYSECGCKHSLHSPGDVMSHSVMAATVRRLSRTDKTSRLVSDVSDEEGMQISLCSYVYRIHMRVQF